jgi:hypothetical protein
VHLDHPNEGVRESAGARTLLGPDHRQGAHTCLEVWSPCHLPAVVATGRGAHLAGPSPRPPCSTRGCGNSFMQLAGTRAGDRRADRVDVPGLREPHGSRPSRRVDPAIRAGAPDAADERCNARCRRATLAPGVGVPRPVASPGTRRGPCRPQRSANAFALGAWTGVAPAGILGGKADDQLLQVPVERRTPTSAMRVGPHVGDQAAVPAQQRLGPDREAGPPGPWQHAAERREQGASAGSNLGRGTWRRSTASWWRRTRISRSLAASPRTSRASNWMVRQSMT